MKKKINFSKTIFTLFIVLTVGLLFCILTSCNNQKNDNTINPGTLKVAVEVESFPWSFKNSNGDPVGINIAYCDKLCKDIGYKVEYVPMEFSKIIDAIEKHEVDISIDNIKVTNEREQKVNFSKPYKKEGVNLYIPTSSALTLDSLREKSKTSEVKIAIEDGTFYNPATDQLNNAKIVEYESIGEILNALKNGEVDAAIDISDSPAFFCVVECNSFPIDNGIKRDVAIAVNKEIVNVIDKLNDAIDKEDDEFF